MLVRVDELTSLPTQMMMQDTDNWWIAELTDTQEYERYCCRNEHGIYTIRISRKNCDWKMAIGDFVSYTQTERKDAAIAIGEDDLTDVQRYYQGHTCTDAYLRADEKHVLIHSTSFESWQKIQKDGCVKSWNILKNEARIREETPIGYALGDPDDFRDYIMLGGGTACEIVVSSRQKGHIVMDPDVSYRSGARLYFDAKRMAKDGVLVRDGAHVKVRNRLPLEPYLIWAATWENIGLQDSVSTPSVFAKMADYVFERKQKNAAGV